MRSPSSRCRSAAFTLIEVIVAMTIFAAGILGVVASLSMSTRAGGAALRQAEAARLAQNRMELATLVAEDEMQAERGEEGPYRWRLSYDGGDRGLMLAEVVVEWDEPRGPEAFTLRQLFLPRQEGS